jgi:hypothetical protein
VSAPNVADPQSGIAGVTFPALTGISGGGPDGLAPYAATYTWTASSAAAGPQSVTATNNADLFATSDFTLTPDTAAPAGGSVSANNGAVHNTSGTVDLAVLSFADSASGIASNAVTRASGTLAGDTCGALSGATAVTVSGGHDAASLPSGCYQYTLTGTDNVGNVATTQSAVVKVDTSAPSAPAITLTNATGASTFINGTTAYINAQAGKSGSFDASATSADADTGIQKLAFPALTGFSAGGGDDTTSPYGPTTYTWSGAVGASGSQTVTAYNNAGNTATSSFQVVKDVAAPTGGSLAAPSGSSTGTFTVTRTDFAEAGPNSTNSGLASSTLTRATSTLVNGVCGSFGGASSLGAGNASESALATGCYQYTLTGTDKVGNAASTSTVVQVDRTAPSAPTVTLSAATGASTFLSATTAYISAQAGNSGGFSAAATSTDADSAIQKISFPALTGFTGGGDDIATPFNTVYAWTGAVLASGPQTVTAFNGVGGTATGQFTVVKDIAAPAGGSVSAAATSTSGTYTVTRADYTEAGPNATNSGLASSTLTRATATLSGTTCGSFGSETAQAAGNVSESGLATGCYRYTLTGKDNVGNVATTATTVQVDRATALVISSVVRDGGNKKVHFTGTGAVAGATITVTICTVNSFPCAAPAATSVATSPTAGAWTSAQDDAQLSNGTQYYAQAVQQGGATSGVLPFTVTGL